MAKTLIEHFDYLSDAVKLDRYRKAIEAAVQPGQTVLDLGCGTGVLGLMALRAGAGKTYFIDEGPVIEIAHRTIAESGFADRADFIQQNSYEAALPQKVDLVVCDHVGFFGFDYGILDLLADAKARFLRPGGQIIPAQIDLMLAPAGSASCRRFVGQWRNGVPDEYRWVAGCAANTRHAVSLDAADLLAAPASLAILETGTDAAPYYSWQTSFDATRRGEIDGVAGWFDCRLFGDVTMSNSPLAAERLNRPQAFLPLEKPVSVRGGEQIDVAVMVRPADNVIAWRVELPESGSRFVHSTFNGLQLDSAALDRGRSDRLAALNDHGRARQLVLSYCDGKRTVADVQALVERDHPDLFPSPQATASFVRGVLAKDTSG